MAKGYQIQNIQEKLIELLSGSRTGLSGVEIAQKLKINRATMAKYLNVIAAEGIIKQKNIGNANLWFIESGTEKLEFPADYFRVKEKFFECLIANQHQQAQSLIRNAFHSGADIPTLINEVVLPAISSLEDLYLKAKIGTSEAKMLRGIISNSIHILTTQKEPDQKRNVILLSADSSSLLYSQAALSSLAAKGWQVWQVGDVSDAIDVLYDLDLQKFITKIWKQKQGVVVIAIFSGSEEGTKFFSESANSIKPKFGKHMHIVVHSRAQKQATKAEFTSDKFESVIQWIESVSGV
ncbi:MAG: ArsR family transcriptional regulator [Nitrososphaeria archaeon]|nr:ArsR family transcriptional regulator [Nitrososphaeria archaeon]NDB50665.1 ArsR family transcriptional regulator [Nitrosopumilaceae archaeon]NDB87553.1 ArsR family transcriptional regulator [Nitrososphaerota archaeon]NDB62263.1 ArsR family transcriptional regulator [Nitrosopumilaceae archaeon]NDB90269.1 ArsR family transcriptional regulator [Nitrososphaerota archaeon]